MTDDFALQQRIEEYLLAAVDWVPSQALCAAFGLASDRILRGVGKVPGLCSGFAISGDKGFKHIDKASTSEYLRFKHRIRRHAVAELVRARQIDRRRAQATRTIKRPAFTYQKDTGQGVLL